MKPKVTYTEFEAMRVKKKTIAELIERYIAEMDTIHPVGRGHRFLLKRLQREPIGEVSAISLTKDDIIAHCKRRVYEDKVIPATVMKDIVGLSGVLKYAGTAWKDCDGVDASKLIATKTFLSKNNLIGTSEPRTRRPTAEEHATLKAYFLEREKSKRIKIPMSWCADWQMASCRRISETCNLLWADWNREEKTILVRKMKDPRNRNKNKLVAMTPEAQAMLVEQYEKRDQNEPRIFPYRAESCSAAYTQAKKATGIDGLHLHDARRDRATRLVQDDGYSPAEATCFTGHETVQVFERTYLKMDASRVKDGPLSKRVAVSA